MPSASGSDRGSASVLILALAAVLALACAVAVALGSVAVIRHQAASAADLGALAAADLAYRGPGPACAAADAVVRAALADRGALVACVLIGGPAEAVEVSVEVRPRGPLAALGRARATARAGQ